MMYFVIRHPEDLGGGSFHNTPTRIHATYQDASIEANRLATKVPDVRFIVVQSIGEWRGVVEVKYHNLQ